MQNRCASSGLTEQIEKWDSANQIFYGPERDTKNFPHPVQPETSPPVRLGFIPDTWFQFFYNKTGVTGKFALTLIVLHSLVYALCSMNGVMNMSTCVVCCTAVVKVNRNQWSCH